MAAIVSIDIHYIFGIPTEEQKKAPVEFLPCAMIGKVRKLRFRFRNDNFVQLFVRTDTGIRRFTPQSKDGKWVVGMFDEQGENRTA